MMGSNGARLAVVGVAVAVIVLLFVVLSGGDDDEDTTTAASGTTTTELEPTVGKAEEKQKDKPTPKPEPDVPAIEVKGGQPVGGVQKLAFGAGEDIVFRVESDTPDHVHFHGYDIFMDVAAGGEVTFDVPADIEGVFEVELEDTAVQIAEITVSPS